MYESKLLQYYIRMNYSEKNISPYKSKIRVSVNTVVKHGRNN